MAHCLFVKLMGFVGPSCTVRYTMCCDSFHVFGKKLKNNGL